MDIIVITLLMILVNTEKVKAARVCLHENQCLHSTYLPGIQSKEFVAFLGIPYAKPPVGKLRFANTGAASSWVGDLNVTTSKPDCIQKNYLLPNFPISGSEDCLYLNIYRPLAHMEKLLPVMVYIHGNFLASANPSTLGPEYIMDSKKVVLVNFAYRIGVFGFLSTGDKSAPGNLAFKDQIMALKWVKKHIKKFGGNPKLVTIFGNGEGGASVHMHTLSSMSKGLFKRAISMSGNAIAPYFRPIADPLAQARMQAKFLNISDYDKLPTNELIAALQEIDAETLLISGDKFKYWHIDPLTIFRPVVDQLFLVDDPLRLVRAGYYPNKVPWMSGFVAHEGGYRSISLVSNDRLREQFNKRFNELLYKLMDLPERSNEVKKLVVNRLVNFYLNGSHKITPQNERRFGDIISDRVFLIPMYRTIRRYVQQPEIIKHAPVFLYKFNYKGPYSFARFYSGFDYHSVVYGDDLIYLFRMPSFFPNDFGVNSTDAKVVATFVSLFTSFAKDGRPFQWSHIRDCNEEFIMEYSFCDYQEFRNSYGYYTVNTSNFFDTGSVPLWNYIVQLH